MNQSIDEILEAAEKATQGPWELTENVVWAVAYDSYDEPYQMKIAEGGHDDLKLIAGAQQLAAEVRRLREREKALTEALVLASCAMGERRQYSSAWERKYGEAWDKEDAQVRAALAPGTEEHA